MIDRQEARSDVARIDPAADRWLHTANRARATTDITSATTTKKVKRRENNRLYYSRGGSFKESLPKGDFPYTSWLGKRKNLNKTLSRC
jgi:hypothetical protein